ncbi:MULTISPECIES: LacI family DNA-binding transcriptional regulator [unclassified Fusibacter]|uniref:LacI family DNA-binding transcriptional regulator n=1 Tax=unclassified Fusibacter TaxID=2624464 RepID=UPI001012CEE2|nr:MULTISPECIES: LacI family DNA-binding transcriptional regulator [unclassified Fusibacter]MCK8061291.1 LacI family transcriptional regulator [Fusibacter sp. A2]NPE23512.1 LacI family transcriptional regulator [Fusibacter sp. A1]RXV59116.1 LacI family transcriptional regulator [Fusibacter sp. A1]
MITIYDIAKACDCSSATVSKALNNYPDININTKERILEKAREMGFTPNSHARALSTKKTWNIGVLFEDESHSGLTHYYFSNILQAVKEQAEEKGYDITFISKNLGDVEMSYLKHCRRRKTDGVVITCIQFDNKQVQELMVSEIPVVLIDHISEFASSIVSDNFAGVYDLTSYLISLGHKDIAYIYGHESYVTTERIRGFKKAMVDADLDIPKSNFIKSNYHDKEATIQAVEMIVKSGNMPTAVIFPDDYCAVWAINTFRSLGVCIPEDISVAGFDGLEIGEMVDPRLTTMKQNTVQLGKQAALKCIDIVESKTETVTQLSVGLDLIKGGTCQEPRK